MQFFRMFALVVVLFLITNRVDAQTSDTTAVEDPALRRELLGMVAKDQAMRTVLIKKGFENLDSLDIAQLNQVDTVNRERLKVIIAQYGWPTKQLVGQDGVEAAFLIVQHADLDPAFQKKMLPLIERAYKAGELSGQEVALLTDRILAGEGKPQRYGTQVEIKGGDAVVKPVENPEKVDELRATMGLPPLEEYLQELKRVYGLSTEKP